MEKIFVYGSLRQDYWNHDKVFKNRIRSIEKGKIKGKLYHLPAGYPAVLKGQDEVYGEIITITQEKILKSVDFLEGYLGEGKENLYTREKCEAVLEDGTKVDCWVYSYVNEREAKKEGLYIPHGDWKKFMDSNIKIRKPLT